MNKGGIHDYCQNSRFAGSARQDSFNKKLVKIAVEGSRRCRRDLSGFPWSALTALWCGLEEAEGLPENALKALMKAHQGFIACPEYNSSITPLLKMRSIGHRVLNPVNPIGVFQRKDCGVNESPGNLGGLRGLVHVRSILGNIGVLVLPDQR